jgi:hypothetical protein
MNHGAFFLGGLDLSDHLSVEVTALDCLSLHHEANIGLTKQPIATVILPYENRYWASHHRKNNISRLYSD